MMQLRVQEVGKGLYPQEVLVEIKSNEGGKKMLIDSRSVHDGYVEIGSPVAKQNGHWLIELPRETTIGEWRVWVSKDEVRGGLENDINRP